MKDLTMTARNALLLTVAISSLGLAARAVAYDDFESYTNNQVLATGSSNTVSGSRWGRFGAATSANPVALTNQGVAGSVGAQYPLSWTAGNNGNLEFWFDAPLDLSAAPGVTARLHIDTKVLSNTTVKAAFEEPDGTIWQSTTGLVLTNTSYTNFVFSFSSNLMIRTTGSGSFGLSSVRDLRLRFENFGVSGSQQVFVDDFGAVTWTNNLVSTNGVVVTNAVFLTSRGLLTENAIWLSGGYRNDTNYVNLVPALAQNMKNLDGVLYWFVNVSSVGSNGLMLSPSSNLSQVPNFLNTLNNWETQHGHRFVVVAWLNASITNSLSNFVDVTNPQVRSNIVGECEKFVSTNVPGSYVSGAARTFDGVHLDFEPSGNDSNRFASLKVLVDQIRTGSAAVGLPGGGHISFAAPRYAVGSSSDRRWSPDFYYGMGQKVNSLGVMLYDTTLTNVTTYQNLVRDQTTNVLYAVAGTYWNDAQHPSPTNNPLVFMGFPAYAASADHNTGVENFTNAAAGADIMVTTLLNANNPAVNYFGGAIVFKQTDGTGNDGAASYTNDWPRFQQKWLWGCLECPP